MSKGPLVERGAAEASAGESMRGAGGPEGPWGPGCGCPVPRVRLPLGGGNVTETGGMEPSLPACPSLDHLVPITG